MKAKNSKIKKAGKSVVRAGLALASRAATPARGSMKIAKKAPRNLSDAKETSSEVIYGKAVTGARRDYGSNLILSPTYSMGKLISAEERTIKTTIILPDGTIVEGYMIDGHAFLLDGRRPPVGSTVHAANGGLIPELVDGGVIEVDYRSITTVYYDNINGSIYVDYFEALRAFGIYKQPSGQTPRGSYQCTYTDFNNIGSMIVSTPFYNVLITKVAPRDSQNYLYPFINGVASSNLSIPTHTTSSGIFLVDFDCFMKLMCKIGLNNQELQKKMNLNSNVSVYPIQGDVYRYTSAYGYRLHPSRGTEDNHFGVDLSTGGSNLPLVAMYAGRVVDTGWKSGGYGNSIKIEATAGNGQKIHYFYAHMNIPALVSENDLVVAGQQIGIAGSTGGTSTGIHLHLEVLIVNANGSTTRVNPNPNFIRTGGEIKEGKVYNYHSWVGGKPYYSYIPGLQQ